MTGRAWSGLRARLAQPHKEAVIHPSVSHISLTRDGVVKAFGLSPELFQSLEDAGILTPQPDGAFDLASVAASLFNYGMANARAANDRLLAAAQALNDTLPALQRLSELPEHSGVEGEARERVTRELSQFFEVFSKALGRATATLQSGEE